MQFLSLMFYHPLPPNRWRLYTFLSFYSPGSRGQWWCGWRPWWRRWRGPSAWDWPAAPPQSCWLGTQTSGPGSQDRVWRTGGRCWLRDWLGHPEWHPPSFVWSPRSRRDWKNCEMDWKFLKCFDLANVWFKSIFTQNKLQLMTDCKCK